MPESKPEQLNTAPMSSETSPDLQTEAECFRLELEKSIRERRFPETPYMYLAEGRSHWLEEVDKYWGNHEEFSVIEYNAKEGKEGKIGELLMEFRKGISDVHHRLSSNIWGIQNVCAEDSTFNDVQIRILKKIAEEATELHKVKKFKDFKSEDQTHPIYQIYGKLLEQKHDMTDEELGILKRDAYKAGNSVAFSRSVDELLSWFVYVDGKKYLHEKYQGTLLSLVRGNLMIGFPQTVEIQQEIDLLDKSLFWVDFVGGNKKASQELVNLIVEKTMFPAYDAWLEKYFPSETVPSFKDYLSPELK